MGLKPAFDKEAMLEALNRMRAASQHTSQANGSKPTNTETYKCLKCRDEEGTFVKVNQEMTVKGKLELVPMDVWRPCECVEARSIERKFKASKVTEEFQGKTFESFGTANLSPVIRYAHQMATIYAQNFDAIRKEKMNSICMLGNPGSGKTHLLMAIANHLMGRNIQVLYFPWVEGFNEIKDDLAQLDARIQRMQQAEVLFIDDMWKGRKAPTEFQIEQAFAIINYRYMEKKPVLISSERSIDEMCDIDEALGSRINEMCKDFRIIMKGGRDLNYRLREDA